MILVDKILGNADDPEWSGKLKNVAVDSLHLDQWEAQKNRIRKKTRKGTELAISLDRNVRLRNGDVLVWNAENGTAVTAEIELQDVLVVKLESVLDENTETIARTCVELGHALGNQHWPAVVKGTTIYIPLTVDRKVMASVMKTHAFAVITYSFAPRTEVIPYLAPHESRRLFGGASSTPHSHIQQFTQQ